MLERCESLRPADRMSGAGYFSRKWNRAAFATTSSGSTKERAMACERVDIGERVTL